jgi:hypothetical protein
MAVDVEQMALSEQRRIGVLNLICHLRHFWTHLHASYKCCQETLSRTDNCLCNNAVLLFTFDSFVTVPHHITVNLDSSFSSGVLKMNNVYKKTIVTVAYIK